MSVPRWVLCLKRNKVGGATLSPLTWSMWVVLCFVTISVSAQDDLTQALQASTRLHPTVLSKRGELSALGYLVEEAEAAKYPTMTAEARNRVDTNNSGLLRLTQPLWAFGRIDQAIDLAKLRSEVGRIELLEIQRKLMEDTAAAYNQVQTQRDRLQIARLNEREHQGLLDMIVRRSQGGLAADADIRLARLRLAQAALTVKQIQSALDKALQDLRSYTQTPLNASNPIIAEWLQVGRADELMQALPDRHATILVRRVRLMVATSELESRKTELYPTVSARFDRDLTPLPSNTYDPRRFSIVLEGRIDGAGLPGLARINAQAGKIDAAREDVAASQVDARQRLANLLIERQLQQESIDAQSAVAQATRETMDSFFRQYDAGRKSWLDLLNTQRELAEARQQLEVAKGAWREQSLRIAVMSGLLDTLAGLEP